MSASLKDRAIKYAEETEKEGDEPTLRTLRCRRDYKAGARDERTITRVEFNDKLRELRVAMEHLRGMINELERIVTKKED